MLCILISTYAMTFLRVDWTERPFLSFSFFTDIMMRDKGDERIAFSEKNIRLSFVYLDDLNLILSFFLRTKHISLYYHNHKNDIYLCISKYFLTDDDITNIFS